MEAGTDVRVARAGVVSAAVGAGWSDGDAGSEERRLAEGDCAAEGDGGAVELASGDSLSVGEAVAVFDANGVIDAIGLVVACGDSVPVGDSVSVAVFGCVSEIVTVSIGNVGINVYELAVADDDFVGRIRAVSEIVGVASDVSDASGDRL
jgi:hypothetical protein